MNRGKKGVSTLILIVIVAVATASVGAVVYISTRPQPNFKVKGLSVSSDKVAQGKPVTAKVKVANIGDAEGTHTVELKIEDEILKRKVSLESGESKNIDFDIEKQEKGTYNLNIEDLSETFEVVEPAKFELSNLVIDPKECEPGKNVTVSVDIQNTGEIKGTHTVKLEVEGTVEKTENVELSPRETSTISFILSRETSETYPLKAGKLSGSFRVSLSGPAEFEVRNLSISPSKAEAGNRVTISVEVTNVGGETGTKTVDFEVDGVVGTAEVEVEPEKTAYARYTVSREEPGEYDVGVEGLTGSFQVLDYDQDIIWVMGTVEDLRNLEFDNLVPVNDFSPKESKRKIENLWDRDFSEQEMKKAERTLQSFGILSEEQSYENIMHQFYFEGFRGLYDRVEKEIYIMRELEGLQKKTLLAHELTHGLQDQKFDLENLLGQPSTEESIWGDESLARNALVEGDAEYIEIDYFSHERGGGRVEYLREKNLALYENYLRSSQRFFEVKGLPLFLDKVLAFPYTGGTFFVSELIQEGGWEKINETYDDPPTSTQQILNPRKYYDNRLNPRKITNPDLTKVIGEKWKLQDNNILGEYGIYALLLDFFSQGKNIDKNVRASTGWRGDSYLTYYHKETETELLSWIIEWNNPENAQIFYNRYETVLEEKYPEANTLEKTDEITKLESGERIVRMEKRQNKVLILEGVPREDLEKTVEKIWDSIQRGEVS